MLNSAGPVQGLLAIAVFGSVQIPDTLALALRRLAFFGRRVPCRGDALADLITSENCIIIFCTGQLHWMDRGVNQMNRFTSALAGMIIYWLSDTGHGAGAGF
jgi:hypothetical protein